ncbi:hypothetical protein OIV83_004481 [Microbotryomycetes sp. JL201]|nr:hypothetical protein OIV83_004481 [Microbotryomycetes sp. JL201]
MDCLICHEFINGDEGVIERHINGCLDGTNRASHGADDASRQTNEDRFVNDAVMAHSLGSTSQCELQSSERAGSEDSRSSKKQKTGRHSISSPEYESHSSKSQKADASGTMCLVCGNSWTEMDIDSFDLREKRQHAQLCREQKNELAGLPTFERGSSWTFDWAVSGKNDTLKGVSGLVPVLGTLLSRAHKEGRTRAAYLASANTMHVGTRLMDAGWGCGYRNIQMFLSSVRHLDQYSTLSTTRPLQIPSILDLQHIIEQAWSHGYDPEGAAHFGNKLVKSRRWIGTTEAYVALTWLGFRVQIYDFPKEKGSAGTNDALVASFCVLLFDTRVPDDHRSQHWVVKYFSDESASKKSKNALSALMTSSGQAVRMTKKEPLYLQHQGHSRTVVGVDVAKDGQGWLLLFDPGKSVSTTMTRAALNASSSARAATESGRNSAFWAQKPCNSISIHSPSSISAQAFKLDSSNWRKLLEPYRVSLKSLGRNEEYQILCLEQGGALKDWEKDARKLITSTKVVGR